MSNFRGGFNKRPYPQPSLFNRRPGPPPDFDRFDRGDFYPSERRDFYPNDRGDFYPPPPRFPRFAPPLDDDDFSDLPMSPFLQRMMSDGPSEGPVVPLKKNILMDLGKTVVSSLKGGQKLSSNPLIRDKLEALIQVEKMEEELQSAPNFGPNRNSFSRYDSFYEKDFVPPIPLRPAPVGMGFLAPPQYPFPPLAPGPPVNNEWCQFLRIGKEMDKNRIYASESELSKYFQMVREKRPLFLYESQKERLKNTFSFEISQTKNPARRDWLIAQHNRITNCKASHYVKSQHFNTPGSKAITSSFENNSSHADLSNASSNNQTSAQKKKRRKDNFSARRREKKILRDKRPPQSDEERKITNYLKALLFDLCGDSNEEHVVLVLRAIATNPCIIKCLMTECNTFLDQKFGTGTELAMKNKKQFLNKYSQTHAEETWRQLQKLHKSPRKVDENIYEPYNLVLSGTKVDSTMFALPVDYLLEPNKKEEEFIVEYKYDFVRFAFEKFSYKLVENFCVTKDRRKRINFFMNNGFLAGLIWTLAQGRKRQLPASAMTYVTNMDKPCEDKSIKIDKKLLGKVLAKENYAIKTIALDFTAEKKLLPDQEVIFDKCIELFDPKASIVKYQLVDYTPYNPLPRDYKLYILNEIMKFVYLQILDCVLKSPDLMSKSYTPMEKDSVEPEIYTV